MQNPKPTSIIKESPERNECGWRRKVVFGKFIYRTLSVYTREQMRYHEYKGWCADEIEYSLDKDQWTNFQEIYREAKRLGL